MKKKKFYMEYLSIGITSSSMKTRICSTCPINVLDDLFVLKIGNWKYNCLLITWNYIIVYKQMIIIKYK